MRTLIISLLMLSSLAHATGEDSESVTWMPLCIGADRALILEHRCFSPGVSGCRSTWPTVQVEFATMKAKTLPPKAIDQQVAELKLSCRAYPAETALKAVPLLSVSLRPSGVLLQGTRGKVTGSATIGLKQLRGDVSDLGCDEAMFGESPSCWGLDQWFDAERRGEDGGVDLTGDPWQMPLMRRVLVFRRGSAMQQVRAVSVDDAVLEAAAVKVINELGVKLLRDGKLDEAEQQLEYASWRMPLAAYNLACLHARRGDAAKTIEALKRAPVDAAVVKKISSDPDFKKLRGNPELTLFLQVSVQPAGAGR